MHTPPCNQFVTRDAIDHCPEKYTVKDVFNVTTNLGKGLTKLQVATVLSRLAKLGKLEIHKQGKGSNPTIFKKSQPVPTA